MKRRCNDRGQRGRVIRLTERAARELGITHSVELR